MRIEEISGIEAYRTIESAHSEVNVVMLTSYNEEAAVTAAIIAGASAYLLKMEPEERVGPTEARSYGSNHLGNGLRGRTRVGEPRPAAGAVMPIHSTGTRLLAMRQAS